MTALSPRVGWFSHELFLWHEAGNGAGILPTGPEIEPQQPVDQSAALRRTEGLLRVSGILDQLDPRRFDLATDEQLEWVHTPQHIARVERVCASGGGELGVYAPAGYHSVAAARLAAGAGIAAVKAALGEGPRRSYCLTRPPGHHAEADRAMALCIFNNVAIAAHAARACGAKRVMIVDWDVHHGNGIEQAFWDIPSVLYISVHQEGLFPPLSGALTDVGAGPARGRTINIPLPPGSGHGAYVMAMQRVLVPAGRRFEPDLILIAAGQDASAFDPMGRQLCTSETYREMTRALCQLADECCGGRLVAIHEGGYSAWYVPFLVRAIVAELAGLPEQNDPYLHGLRELPGQRLQSHQQTRIDQVLEAHRGLGLLQPDPQG